MRDKLTNISWNHLNKVINGAANHELILKYDKAAKKGNFTPNLSVPAQNVENPNNSNNRKRQWKCTNWGRSTHQGGVLSPQVFQLWQD